MGNSPSQQTAEGAQGEPEEFDLNAISDGSGEDEMPPRRQKSLAQADPISAPTLRSSQFGTSLSRKLRSTKSEHQPLEDYDYPPPPVQDAEMDKPDEKSSADTSSNAITFTLPNPLLPATQTGNHGGTKRKRDTSVVKETPVTKPRKKRKNNLSPPTSTEFAEERIQGSTAAIDRATRKDGLQALERDAELSPQEAGPSLPPSPRLPPISDMHRTKSSVDDVPETQHIEDDAAVDEPQPKRSIATSVAKRTFPIVVKKADGSSRNIQENADNSDDAFDNEYSDGSDADSSTATPASLLASKPRDKHLAAVRKAGFALKRSPRTPLSVGRRTRRDFEVEASDDGADSGRPPARKKRTCFECGDVFRSRRLLEEHEKETKHSIDNLRTEVTGRFSEYEVQKLAKYKKDFCHSHNISGHEFNDMMTDSCRRGAHHAWSCGSISKHDFLVQYYDVLPNRNRKSLARFRERNWQNATGSQDWTTEDDDQIVKLVGEIGTKWVEIGQTLTRTQDAVQQRWMKHLQYRDTKREGVWSAEEIAVLEKSVVAAKRKSGLSDDSSTDKRIAWAIVSHALNGTRTPKQCADHWHQAQESRGRHERRGRILRLRKRPPRKRATRLSSPYVNDSENELDGSNHSEDIGEDGDHGDQLDLPELPPDPIKRTPKKITTLSQAFANTQANTSALRRSQRHEHEVVSDQPSPRLPSQAMVQLPAMQETAIDVDENEIAETEEAIVTQEPSTLRSTAFTSSQGRDQAEDNVSDSESEEESDDDSEEDDEVVVPSKSKASPFPELASSREEAPAKEQPVNDNDLQPLPELQPSDTTNDTQAYQSPLDGDITSSSADSDDASEEETASGSDDDSSDDSMEQETRNDFMKSIKQSARKAKLADQKKRWFGAKVVKNGDESGSESGTDSDSDAESIAHG